MSTGFRRLSGNAIAGVFQALASTLILLELYRFLVRELGPAQVGVWSLIIASVSIARFADLGLGGGIAKFVAEDMGGGRRDRAAATLGMMLASIGGVIALASIVAAPIVWHFLPELVREPDLLQQANALVPWALTGLWLAALASILSATLDACQRTTWRAAVVVGAAAAQLAAVYFLVPTYGLAALGPAHVLQNALALIAAAVLVRRSIGGPLRDWLRFDSERFRSLFRYGSALQLVTLGQMLFDPVAKILLARFGGLATTGYFEMVNRAAIQARAIIVAAYQALVPYLATKAGERGLTAEDVRRSYVPAFRLLFVVITPGLAAAAIAMPALVTVWLGKVGASHLLMALSCLLGWYANTLSAPAHMHYLALGRLKWIVWSCLVIGSLNVVLGWSMGAVFGGLGVVAGAMLALGFGSILVLLALHGEYAITLRGLSQTATLGIVLTSVAGLAWAVGAVMHWKPDQGVAGGLWVAGGFAAIYGIQIWRHPSTGDLVARLRAG